MVQLRGSIARGETAKEKTLQSTETSVVPGLGSACTISEHR